MLHPKGFLRRTIMIDMKADVVKYELLDDYKLPFRRFYL